MNSLQISQATDMFKKSQRKEHLQFLLTTESVLKSKYLEKGCSSSLHFYDIMGLAHSGSPLSIEKCSNYATLWASERFSNLLSATECLADVVGEIIFASHFFALIFLKGHFG